MNFIITEFRKEHTEPVTRLWRESMQNSIGIPPVHSFESQAYFLSEILPQSDLIFVAICEKSAEPLGFMATDGRSLNQLYIASSAQGQGIGTALLNKAKEGSEGRLRLRTFKVNKTAQRFYEKNGFVAAGGGSDNEEGLPDILYQWIENTPGLVIRDYAAEDAGELRNLFFNTIRKVNSKDYTLEQVRVWAPDVMDDTLWQSKMDALNPFIAEMDNKIVGYGDLQSDGLIDHLFVHKDYQGRGIASQLIFHILSVSGEKNQKRLYSHVSLTAKPFFKLWGFEVIRQQQVEKNGEKLTNFLMQLEL